METTDTANLGDDTRPTKRIRSPPRNYEYPANELSTEEERMLAQAIANSRTDQCRQPLTVIPFGPTFYPTIEDFSGDPLEYLETIRHEAEKYGEFVMLMHDFCSNCLPAERFFFNNHHAQTLNHPTYLYPQTHSTIGRHCKNSASER